MENRAGQHGAHDVHALTRDVERQAVGGGGVFAERLARLHRSRRQPVVDEVDLDHAEAERQALRAVARTPGSDRGRVAKVVALAVLALSVTFSALRARETLPGHDFVPVRAGGLRILGVVAALAFVLDTVQRVITVFFRVVPLRAGVDEYGSGWMTEIFGYGRPLGVTMALVRKIRVLIWSGAGLLLLLASQKEEAKEFKEAQLKAQSEGKGLWAKGVCESF